MEKRSFPNKQMSSKGGVNVSPKGNHMFGKSAVKTAKKQGVGLPGTKKMVGFTGVSNAKKQ